MRSLAMIALLVFLGLWGACSTTAPETRAGAAPGPNSSAPVGADVLAFRPLGTGRCPAGYSRHSKTCVHEAFRERTSADSLAAQVALYERGGAPPPRLGSVAPAPVKGEKQLDPGALQGAQNLDADAARRERLAMLDRMIASVEAKLHKPATAPTPAPPSQAKDEAKPAPSLAGAAPKTSMDDESVPNASDEDGSEDERMSELSGLLRQLSPDQLKSTLNKLEEQGARRELGEDKWRELMKGTYLSTQGVKAEQ